MGPSSPWTLLLTGREDPSSACCAVRLFHDREAHRTAMTIFLRDLAPAVFGLLAGLERAFDLGGAFHELVEVHRAELAANHPEIAAFGHVSLLLAELVHRVVGAARLQRGFTCEILLVLVADIGAGHVLMLGAGDTLADLLALDILHVAEHALLAEILPREIVSRQGRR